ncbi:zinc finger, C3HC4 type-domain-containing protein [Thamnidium elegans]|nr:zinc finger, C3HC4 type-domain-containing protein [Thamnidium elegans]
MQNMTSNELSKLPPKTLKEYIHAYNLPFKSAIEKNDLVRIIFNTRPISNQSETYYRKHRTKQPSSNNDEPGNSFSFTNIVQEIFSPPAAPHNRQEQARQHEEHNRRQQEQSRRQREEQEEQARRQREERENQARRLREEQQRRMRHHTQSTSPTPPNNFSSPPARPTSASPPLSNDNLLSLHDLIKNKIDPASLSVRTLKSILKSNYVKQSHVIEKSELVKLVVRLADQHRAEMESSKRNEEDESGGSGGNEDLLCRVCFDRQQNCVFLDCGHMATCIECAKKLIETRNECPICREPILKLVHVFRS